MANKIHKIIEKIYYLWILLSILVSIIYFFYNFDFNIDYLPTYILFILISILCLIVYSKINVNYLIYSYPIAYLIVSIFFKYHKIPDLLIFSINRIILLCFILLPDIKIKYKRVLKILYLNILFFIVFIEIIFSIIFNFTGIDILKRKNEIMSLNPKAIINNVKVNEYGFLGDPINIKTSKPKWVFIGDSQGVGVVDYKYNFINIIGDSFNICDINLSKPGASPLDYYSILKTIIKRDDIEKIFIVLFSGNDIQEWFIPENNRAFENMRIINFFRNIIQLNSKNMYKNDFEENTFYSICHRRAKTISVALLHRFDNYIKRIKELAYKNNKELYFIVIPSEFTINKSLQKIIDERYGKIDNYMFSYNYIINTLDRLNCNYLDTYNYLKDKEGIFVPFNTHLSIYGNMELFKCFKQWVKNETFDKKSFLKNGQK